MDLAVFSLVIKHMHSSRGIYGNLCLSTDREIEPPLDADHVRLGVVGDDVRELVGLQPIHAPHVLARSSGALPDSTASWQRSHYDFCFRSISNLLQNRGRLPLTRFSKHERNERQKEKHKSKSLHTVLRFGRENRIGHDGTEMPK